MKELRFLKHSVYFRVFESLKIRGNGFQNLEVFEFQIMFIKSFFHIILYT